MKSVMTLFFLMSALLFFGTIKYLLDIKRFSVYPPKQVLKQRAAALAGCGSIFLILALILGKF